MVKRAASASRNARGSSVIDAKSGAGLVHSRRLTCPPRYAGSPASTANARRRASASAGTRSSRFSIISVSGRGQRERVGRAEACTRFLAGNSDHVAGVMHADAYPEAPIGVPVCRQTNRANTRLDRLEAAAREEIVL